MTCWRKNLNKFRTSITTIGWIIELTLYSGPKNYSFSFIKPMNTYFPHWIQHLSIITFWVKTWANMLSKDRILISKSTQNTIIHSKKMPTNTSKSKSPSKESKLKWSKRHPNQIQSSKTSKKSKPNKPKREKTKLWTYQNRRSANKSVKSLISRTITRNQKPTLHLHREGPMSKKWTIVRSRNWIFCKKQTTNWVPKTFQAVRMIISHRYKN